jgi:hypothetical protein
MSLHFNKGHSAGIVSTTVRFFRGIYLFLRLRTVTELGLMNQSRWLTYHKLLGLLNVYIAHSKRKWLNDIRIIRWIIRSNISRTWTPLVIKQEHLYFYQGQPCVGDVRDLQTGYGLDDWIYIHFIHSTHNYKWYSATADLHTLQFTVTHTSALSLH